MSIFPLKQDKEIWQIYGFEPLSCAIQNIPGRRKLLAMHSFDVIIKPIQEQWKESISVLIAKLSVNPIGSHVTKRDANFYCSPMVLGRDRVNMLIG